MITLFLEESFWYLIAAGFLQALAAILGVPVICLFSLRADVYGVSRRLVGYAVFNALLLFWGIFGHFGFHVLTYDKLYFSVDRIANWLPFIPFGQWVLDRGFGPDSHGALIGDATLWQLRWIWAAFALPVWLLALASTRWVMRRWMPRALPA